MFYEMPNARNKQPKDMWPQSDKYISARTINTNEYVDIPLINDNILIIGKTGFGKTTLTKKITEGFINVEEEPFSVFLDVKDDFRQYIRPEDKAVCFVNSFNNIYNIFKWNIIKEIRQSDDWESELESIADVLFSDLSADSKNKFWVSAAKETFKGYLRTILYRYTNNPPNRTVFSGMKYMSLKELLTHIAEHKPNSHILRDYFGYDINNSDKYIQPKRAGDIMAFLSTVLQRFTGSFFSDDGQDTVHDFISGNYGKRLFLIYDYSKKASSNIFFKMILSKIIENRLSQTVDRSKKFLLVLDEAGVLETDFGLLQGATLGRGNGLQIILSSQSIEKLYCIAPALNAEHITNASLSGFPTIISFSPGDAETINKLQQIFGNKRKQIISMPISRYSQPTNEIITEPIVTAEELSNLDVGECFVKIRNAEPERVKILL